MTAARGDAAGPTDDRPPGGAGPSTDESASDAPAYDLGARWHRYRTITPTQLPPDRELFAVLPVALVLDRTIPARAVRLYAAIYLEVYNPRARTAVGLVDVHQVCADVRICPSLARRYMAQLERAGWILERRTERRPGLVGLVKVRLNLARRGTVP